MRRGRGAITLAAAVCALAWAVPVQAAPRPNVVLVVTDDQAYDSVSRMPFLNGRTDWKVFANAFLNNPLCCPSRATILSGRYSHRTGVETNLDAGRFNDRSTLATWLRGAGYRTGLFGKYLNQFPPAGRPENYIPPGWNNWAGFVGEASDYYDYRLNAGGRLVAHGSAPQDYSTDVLAARALAFVDSTPRARPFFLLLAPRAPHGPRTPAPRHTGAYSQEPAVRRPDFNEADVADKPAFYRGLEPVPEERTDRARREHHAALLAVDDAIRAIHGRVAARGQLGRTVFVSLSDNGFSFGEHRWVGKRCPYEECVRTPLRIRLPGAGGGRVARLASNVDIAPTILELAGVARPRGLNGRSLVGVLRGRAGAWRTEVLLRGKREPGPHPPSFWGLRTARHKYVQTEGTGEVELYDLLADPFELNNLAGSAKHARLRAYFARRLATLRR